MLDFLDSLDNNSIRTLGPELIFCTLFALIGFNTIPGPLLRDIVVARLAFPTSKLKTADYLDRYQGEVVSVDSIYLFLDRLNARYAQQARQIAADHSRKLLSSFSVVFYDMTTIYFEAEDEDDLRRIGFSKDGKFQHPQIMLGLLVGENGFPIGYDLFEGNTFVGKTLLPVLKKIEKEHGIGQPVVVADSAMLSKDNLRALKEAGYPFIVAARLRSENLDLQKRIITQSRGLTGGASVVIDHPDGHRLVIAYSDKRAKRDVHNRQRGLDRLRKQVSSGKLSKSPINNRGYNKFLKLIGEVKVDIDDTKVEQAQLWDGLKGYLTSTALPPGKVIESYGQLWQIESAFRVSKTDLRVRPIYHRRRRRIEAHVLVAFMAYAIVKELERRLRAAGIEMSPRRAGVLTQILYGPEYRLSEDPTTRRHLLRMSDPQRERYDLLF